MCYNANETDPKPMALGIRREEMEKQTVTITIQTQGETCEMTDEEIKAWYAENVAKLFDPAYGTPAITVELKREKTSC